MKEKQTVTLDREALYEAMQGIGEDLLARSEAQTPSQEAAVQEKTGQDSPPSAAARKPKQRGGGKWLRYAPLLAAAAVLLVVTGRAGALLFAPKGATQGVPCGGAGDAAAPAEASPGEAYSMEAAAEVPAEEAAEAGAAEAAAEETAREALETAGEVPTEAAADTGEAAVEAAAEAEEDMAFTYGHAKNAPAGETAAGGDGTADALTDAYQGRAETAAGGSLPADAPETGIAGAATESAEVAADMAACFVYGGRLYTEDGHVPAEEIAVGAYVTSIRYGIDEWTEESDYEDGTGTFEGDVYAVKGKPQEETLCVPEENGTVWVFRAVREH